MKTFIRKIIDRGILTTIVLAGPIAVAAAHFLLSIALLPHVSAAEYGVFAFGMVLYQIATGVSDGLIGSPMAVRMAGRNTSDAPVFASVNILYCAFVFVVIFSVLATLVQFYIALAFAVFSATSTLRWFGRGYVITTGNRYYASLSDLVYAVVLGTATCATLLFANISLLNVIGFMIIASITALFFLGPSFAQNLRRSLDLGALKSFVPILKEQSAWSTLAVVANAATIESHVFVVTLLAGSQAFAPVAVATLCFRPTLIGIYSLSQYERPQISKIVIEGRRADAWRQTITFLFTAGLLWLGNAVAIACALAFFSDKFSSIEYDKATVISCIIAIAIVMLIRTLRQPLLTLVQADNRFRSIASATIVLAPVSILCSVAGLHCYGVVGSIYGMLLADSLLLSFMVYLSTGSRVRSLKSEQAS